MPIRICLISLLLTALAHADSAVAPQDAAPGPVEHRMICGDVTAIWRGHREVVRANYQRKHVLLLKSRYGPYHVVRTDRLRAYLRGAKPDHVLDGVKDPNGITGTGVFRAGGWVSSDEIAYTWGCCDPPITTRFWLPRRD